jgi:hypothetical protein
VSVEAQAFLGMGPLEAHAYPALDDVEGWRKMIAATDAMVLAMFEKSGLTSPDGFYVDEISLDGVKVYAITPPGRRPDDNRVYLEAHAGAFIVGGERSVERRAS